jgi:hypothetical protein
VKSPRDWIPNRDTLAVLDYAGSKSVGGQPAFQWLESVFLQTRRLSSDLSGGLSSGYKPRVRIILIDRTEQGPLWRAWRNSETEKDLEKLTLQIPLEANRVEFDEIVHAELCRRLGREPASREREAIQSLIPRLRGQFRPLFGMLAAAAVAEASVPATQRWSPELLIENVLKAQARQWSAAHISDEHLDLLFEATLTQGECNAHGKFMERVEALSPEILASLTSLSEESFKLGPIVPDLLGEFFVLMRLRGQAMLVTRQRQASINTRIAHEVLGRSWRQGTTAAYAGLVLEDFLSLGAADRSEPAVPLSLGPTRSDCAIAVSPRRGNNQAIAIGRCGLADCPLK